MSSVGNIVEPVQLFWKIPFIIFMKLQSFYKTVFQFTVIQKKNCISGSVISCFLFPCFVFLYFSKRSKRRWGIGRTLNFSLLAAMYMSCRPMRACFVSYAIKSEHTNRVCIVDVYTCECMCVDFWLSNHKKQD